MAGAGHGHSHGGIPKESVPGVLVGTTDQMQSLVDVIEVNKASVLNAESKSSVASLFGGSGGLIRSDTDAQLLIVVPFREKVKIRCVLPRVSPQAHPVAAQRHQVLGRGQVRGRHRAQERQDLC